MVITWPGLEAGMEDGRMTRYARTIAGFPRDFNPFLYSLVAPIGPIVEQMSPV
jgi:hypothetical protein